MLRVVTVLACLPLMPMIIIRKGVACVVHITTGMLSFVILMQRLPANKFKALLLTDGISLRRMIGNFL